MGYEATVNLSVSTATFTERSRIKSLVFIEVAPGKTISPEQVNGIVMLVANAVKDLDPANVSVIDNKGLC